MTSFFEIAVYYWPKLIAGAWFAIFNFIVFRKAHKKKFHVGHAIALFFISSAFLAILGELIGISLLEAVTKTLHIADDRHLLYVGWSIVTDFTVTFLGGLAFVYLAQMRYADGFAVYLEYACIEHLCMILAVDQVTYLICYIVIQILFFLMQKKDLQYILKKNTIQWKNIMVYLIGLLYVLDALYGTYILFPQFNADSLDPVNVFWLDGVALITSIFIAGFIKMCVSEAKQHDSKISYMQKFQEGQEHIIQTFAELSEAKSGETGQHVRRVAEYSKILALRLGLDDKDTEYLRIAAMMHDVGKLMISPDILEKPGKLTEAEYEIVKTHTTYGGELLSNSEGSIMKLAKVIALQHHERWDGTGYPNGLKEEEIDLCAQIVSVADVYDALTSERCYKKAWPPEEAKEEILTQRGKQFSPKVVDAFLDMYDEIEKARLAYLDK